MNDETKNDVAVVRAALELLEEFNLPYIVDKLANALAALDRLEARVERLEHELETRELVRRTNLEVNKALSQDIIAVKAECDTLAKQLATARGALREIVDRTLLDADPPELRAQNACNYRRAQQAPSAAETK